MHHESYNPKDVLAHTIELCPSCHGIYNKEAGVYERSMSPWKRKMMLEVEDAEKAKTEERDYNLVLP
jgi:hypothetical protein